MSRLLILSIIVYFLSSVQVFAQDSYWALFSVYFKLRCIFVCAFVENVSILASNCRFSEWMNGECTALLMRRC